MPWIPDCGSGRAVEALADSFEEVVGLDLSAPLIENARAKRARPNVRYVVEDLGTPEGGGAFGTVGPVSVIFRSQASLLISFISFPWGSWTDGGSRYPSADRVSSPPRNRK
ncbi:class I SAM-dependent methyltransferase [Streptomyces sp. NPDC004838]